MKHLSVFLLATLMAACGTDHPFDRGDDLPPGNEVEVPTGPVSFAADVKPILQSCTACHSGGAGGWVYAGGAESYAAVIDVIDELNPDNSELLIKAIGGDGHGGGTLFSASSASYETIIAWIEQGAEDN